MDIIEIHNFWLLCSVDTVYPNTHLKRDNQKILVEMKQAMLPIKKEFEPDIFAARISCLASSLFALKKRFISRCEISEFIRKLTFFKE